MREFSVGRLGELLAGSPPSTVWRFDVDVSPLAAVEMAEFAADLGIDGTFYVMLSSPFYSERDALELMVVLSGFGHRIGLHLDERHAGRLWSAAWKPPVSFHCPTDAVLWKDFDWCENAYAPRWQGRYMSDARGVFRDGDPEDRWDGEPFQVALHPCWWFEPNWAEARGVTPELYRRFFHEEMPCVAV